MQFLKQSTAVTLKIGPFLDDTDGKTAETGLTISQADVRLSKNGGNIAQKNEASACTHDELGIYGCPIDATDTNTLGRLQLWVHESGALPVFHEYMVVPANVYDSLFSSDYLQVDVTQAGGSAIQQTGGYFKVKDDEGNTVANESKQDTIDSVVDAIKAVTDNLPDSGALNDLAAILTDTGTTLPGTLSTIAGYIDTEIAAIKAVTDNLPDSGALNDLAAIKAVTDNLPDSGALTTLTAYVDELESRLTAARAGYLDELAAANLPADIDTLKGYCDILDDATNGLANIKSLIDTLDAVADAVKAKTDNLPSGVPKNVALSNFQFLMVLSSDHITPATGKTITAQISKDGGAFAGCTNSVSEIGNGVYKINLTQTEMNADVITLKFTETDCDQRTITIITSS